MKIEKRREVLEVVDADLANSTYHDVNMSGTRIDTCNLSRLAIAHGNLVGMSFEDCGMSGSSFRTTSRNTLARVAASGATDSATIVISAARGRCRCCRCGRYMKSLGGSAIQRYFDILAIPTTWTNGPLALVRRRRLPTASPFQ